MVNQASMNGNSQHRSPAAGMRRSFADFTHDLLTLAELQVQLLLVDLRDGKSQSIVPVVLIIAGLLITLGTIPVGLLGISWLLVDGLGVPPAVAMLLTTVLALATAVGLAWLGWRRLQSAFAVFTRSRKELKENISWIKHALKHRGVPTGRSYSNT